MSLFCAKTRNTLLLGALAVPASALPIELLSMGDSTTFGVGSDTNGLATTFPADNDLGGYRFYLDRALSSEVDFVGNRADGSGTSGFADNQHFGVRAASAAVDTTFNGIFTPSMLTGIDKAGTDPTSVDAAFNPDNATPNAVLLGIGINSLPKKSFSTSGADNAAKLEAQIAGAVDQFNTFLDGDGVRIGLVDRLTDNAYFANDAHLFVARITPRLDGEGDNSVEEFITKRQPQTVADYNNRITAAVEDRQDGTVSTDLAGRVTFVDLFSISIAELDTQALADEFYGGNLAQLMAAISPHDDATDGGLDYVDWVNSSTFDEGGFDNGTYAGDQLVSDVEGANVNFDLMPDGLHPSNLGYAINAQVWANAINEYYSIPEPSALVLLAGGGLIALSRRRRCAF